MEKFITKEDLENAKPIEPKYLRWKIFLGFFITATLFALLLSVAFYFMIINALFILTPLITTYLTMGLFGSTYLMEKRVFMTFKFVQKWLGIYEYNEQTYKYYSLLNEYERQQKFKDLTEKYKNYN